MTHTKDFVKSIHSVVNYDTFCRDTKNKGWLDGREGTGARKYFWIGIRLTPEYLMEMEQSTLD